ncbi:MAG: SDR family NAD(P)-dependent oxidoreductase [Planctomycetota bacterium]|nr:SDR family NAD(P)-dependent oxidoreductase [Planctomycetota bacterium]
MTRRTIGGTISLVTGASSGIGKAIALELGKQGSNVLLLARREKHLQSVCDQILQSGGQAGYIAGDITDPAVRTAALKRIADNGNRLDILVNNAGRGALGRFEDADPGRLRGIFETNFFAVAELTREALPLLMRGSNPVIVNVGSILGHRATPRNSEYCASKFALRGWTESIRAELAKSGIDVLMVSPGTTETEFFQSAENPNEKVPWPEQRGVSAAYVAQATLAAIRAGKREIIPNSRGRILIWANRLFPGLVDRWMRRYG